MGNKPEMVTFYLPGQKEEFAAMKVLAQKYQQAQGRLQRQQQPRPPAVKLSKKEGDPADDKLCKVYNDKGDVVKHKGKDGKEVDYEKKWAKFTNAERDLWRKHSGGSSTVVIIVIVVLVLAIIGAVMYFLMCTGGSEDDDEELVEP